MGAEATTSSCANCQRLQAQVEALSATVAQLQASLARLESQLAAARKDSTTSSKPPSSDIVKPPPPPPPAGQDKRRRGGQPGHPKHERALFPPERPCPSRQGRECKVLSGCLERERAAGFIPAGTSPAARCSLSAQGTTATDE